MRRVEQTVVLKESVVVKYEGRILYQIIRVKKVYVCRSGLPAHVVDEDNNLYEFEYLDDDDKMRIYRAVIKNLIFKNLI